MPATYEPRTAIVIGASLAGMLSAHVAARRFDRVVLVDRGDPPNGMEPRRSVPQERHVHLLLQRGKRVLESLFPGFLAELERHGAVVADASRDVQWFHRDRWKRRFDTGITTHYCSRGLIDHVVRERIKRDPRIRFEPSTRVTGLLRGDDGGISGITTESGGAGRSVDADLVIDAGGRGSRAGHWLAELGLPMVRTSQVLSRLGYGTRIYRKHREYDAAWKVLLVLPRPPGTRRMGVISPIEGDRWMVTTGGWLGECPGTEEAEFLEFLRGLPDRAIYDVVRRAEPLSDIAIYRIPGGLRRHYEELADWPARLLVIGDAVCSLNPIYSQGMTVSALEVDALSTGLDELVGRGASPDATRTLQRRIAAQVDGPWQMAESEDLRFPQVAGQRSWRLMAQHAYGSLVADASAVDATVLRGLLGVIHLIEPPERLLAPAFRARVLASAVRARFTAGPMP
jgi:2-polyprenyl-6-methoxyphenol hydroxylase-like FAD-dependent oxidoreductase